MFNMFTSRKFEISKEEHQKIKEWDKSHECPHRGKSAGAIGGSLSITFTPTSIGVFVKVNCSCGAELTVNDGSDF